MGTPFLFLVLSLVLSSPFSSSTTYSLISKGSSLSPPADVLVSPNRVFSAGFHSIGHNAYCFAIWYNGSRTVVWMANRDQPVNGRLSKLSLPKTGNLILTDAGRLILWSTNTASISSVQLKLYNTGNLVLRTSKDETLWQRFDSPTNTLLPNQPFTKNTTLVSSRSQSNFSPGFYELYFDDDNILRLLFDGPEISSVYWPSPSSRPWEVGRSTYNNSKIALLDSSGYFKSSDDLSFTSADLGIGPQRRLTLDVDGNIRLYSLLEKTRNWSVSWQAYSNPCRIHGICGPNGLCNYVPASGRRCSCIPGYKLKNHTDWSYGCEPNFKLSGDDGEAGFIKLPHVEFYGYDIGFFENYTLKRCENECLKYRACKGFQYKFNKGKGYYLCYPKTLLLNGNRSLGFGDPMYIRLPKAKLSSYDKPI